MKSKETRLVMLLCLLAGMRVWVFSAAFPFIINMDEDMHLDMVVKYAAGNIPRGIEHFSAETAAMIAGFGTSEYNVEWYEDSGPIWTLPQKQRAQAQALRDITQAVPQSFNHDSTGFPLYYATAGSWYRIGKALGLRGGNLLYWLRFLNVPIYMLLVWIAYLMTRKLYPGNRFLILGVPTMLVFFPQDVFYAVNSDVLSGLLATLSLYMLVIYYLEQRSVGFCILAGLSVAAACLTKLTNIPLSVFFMAIIIAKTAEAWRTDGFRACIPRCVSIMLAAALPVGAWLLRNQLVLGELSGSHAKIARLGWTVKPFGQLLHHPIFTFEGELYFLSTLTKTFWRGEIAWHKVGIASPAADSVYVLTSLAFLLAAAVLALKHREARFSAGVSFLALGLSVAFLAGLSLMYDFRDCYYPSRELPFFTSGRLILAALVPFLMLYLSGLEVILSRARLSSLRWVALALLLLIMIGSEIHISGGVFASAYNFYHMLGN